MVVEINNVKQQEQKRCGPLPGNSYLLYFVNKIDGDVSKTALKNRKCNGKEHDP
ncbi:hypothetical protein HPP92_028881 [Vanilla planifolia]|uniref:Uncharacterized protein n=1 Tax=Vanilla planifolia TaxID=51239 RepID=A0A835U2V8_VANPL|nr:hypothetical protein HPP92_028881 [Vanilla planifolia]